MGGTNEASDIAIKAAEMLDQGLSYGLNLLSAILILIAGFTLSRWASRLVRTRLEAIESFDTTLVPFAAQVTRYGILIFTAILVLAEFGVQTASIIAVLGAAGLAIGLALQGTLQNVAAGIMLLILRPFRVRDYIEAGGVGGTVDEIGLFMTRMHTPQGLFVAVPNSKIWSSTIINYSLRPRRRLDLVIGISYEDDIDTAIALLQSLLAAEKRIYKQPAPQVFVKELGESSVDLEIRAWTSRQNYWDVRGALLRAIKYALDEAGISIPYPHRDILVRSLDGATLAPSSASAGKGREGDEAASSQGN